MIHHIVAALPARLRVTLFLSLALIGLCGAPRPGHAARERVAVTVDSTFFNHTIKSMAVLEMLTPTFDDDRVYKMQDMVEGALSEKGNFTIMYPDDLKRAAEKSGAAADYATLVRVWQQRRVIEAPAMAKVAADLGIDAIVGIEVTHWEQYQIDLGSEGNSTTTVGLKVSMYSAADQVLLWQAAEVYVAKSPPYNPSNAIVDAGGEARAASKSVAPKPPEYVPTAQRVVKEIFATWPKEGKGEKKDGKKGDK